MGMHGRMTKSAFRFFNIKDGYEKIIRCDGVRCFIGRLRGAQILPEHREQIKTVKVLPVKWEPGKIHYFGRAQNTGMAFGAIWDFFWRIACRLLHKVKLSKPSTAKRLIWGAGEAALRRRTRQESVAKRRWG